MKRINLHYLNMREQRNAQLVSHQAFQHSAATSNIYGQTGEGLNLMVDGELKVSTFYNVKAHLDTLGPCPRANHG
jgi:hypothetical protein